MMPQKAARPEAAAAPSQQGWGWAGMALRGAWVTMLVAGSRAGVGKMEGQTRLPGRGWPGLGKEAARSLFLHASNRLSTAMLGCGSKEVRALDASL